ncbi:glycosyltransferase (plasmid) [Tundrisphaera lichenicola]|uniref:glycosyltransferase n=1 Tax=Tundrisphaera lichenicola TaxID=2029860 RepID=UPI003EC0174B
MSSSVSTPRVFHIAICGHMPKDGYSGGRYYTWVLGEALAAAGHDVTFWTNARPVFADDFVDQSRCGTIRVELSQDFSQPPRGPFDLVVIVPDQSKSRILTHAALLLARRDVARIALVNFESPNWYNAHSPEPRDPALWELAVESGRSADLVLSLAAIGSDYARDFYVNVPPTALFRHCHPAINSVAADRIGEVPKLDQIVCLTRFVAGDRHKGAGELVHAIGPAMRGMTLLIVVGRPVVDETIMAELTQRAESVGAHIELVHGLDDAEKFRRISQSRAMLFLSYFEGFGYPPVEAQYCGVPCVAYDLPVLREVSGDALIYVTPGDHATLPGAVAEALAWPPERRAALRERIAPVARLGAFASRIDAIAREVVALPGPPGVMLASKGTVTSWKRSLRPALDASRPGLLRKVKSTLKAILRGPVKHRTV